MSITSILHELERAATWIAGLSVFLAMLIIALDIIFRLFKSDIPGSVEFITYYLIVAIVFMPLAKLERTGEMISMDLLMTVLPRPVGRAIEASAALIGAGVYALLTIASASFAMEKLAANFYVITSTYVLFTWPAYFMLPLAFTLGGVMSLLRGIERLRGPDIPSPEMSEAQMPGAGK